MRPSTAGTTTTVTLTVSKAAPSVTAQAASKTYGAANPAFTVAYGGFVNGDDAGDLTGTLAFATAATASSAPGGYPVTPSGLTAANYTLSFVAGTLTVKPAPLTITADRTRAGPTARPTCPSPSPTAASCWARRAASSAARSVAAPPHFPIERPGGTLPDHLCRADRDELRPHLPARHPHRHGGGRDRHPLRRDRHGRRPEASPPRPGARRRAARAAQSPSRSAGAYAVQLTSGPVVDGVATATFPLVGVGAGSVYACGSYGGTANVGTGERDRHADPRQGPAGD